MPLLHTENIVHTNLSLSALDNKTVRIENKNIRKDTHDRDTECKNHT